MKANLLVVADRKSVAPVVGLLQKEGYACWQARGPLRVRTVLNTRRIDLILWKEEKANPELSADFLREWERFPDLPVVHLFSRGTGPSAVPGTMRESLALESCRTQLIPLVARLLRERRLPEAEPTPPNTELAFRKVVSALRTRKTRGAGRGAKPTGDAFPTAGTSLNPSERKMLTSPVAEAGSQEGAIQTRMLAPLFRLFSGGDRQES